MILAEDLLLLLLDDSRGRPVADGTRVDLALAGAVLLELATASRVDVSGPEEATRPGRLVVRDATPTGDAVLDEALRRLAAAGPRPPQDLLGTVAKGLREELLARLVSRGILRSEEGRVLGLFPTRCWPAVDSRHEAEVRQGLHDVLVVGRAPLPREAALVCLLQAVDQVARVLRDTPLDDGELRRRARAVAETQPAEGEFAGPAVRRAVEAVNTAALAGVAGAAVVAAGTSGS